MEFVEYTIGEITKSIRTGTTPTKTNKFFFDGEFLWVTPSDLKGQMVLEETEFTISKLAIDSKQAFLYNKDTVLVSTIGDIGKVSINQIPLASNQQITGIELKPEIILPEVFFYWVKLNKGLLQFKANKAIISILTNKHLKKN
ncbi:restriction endonuclease subunit S [Niabella sp. W65]|nr:restriction endonuclease subunit S [Niabella sp. W65]MCH7365203.1 restriction endonuclease subunit S [Niabella sp. W65]